MKLLKKKNNRLKNEDVEEEEEEEIMVTREHFEIVTRTFRKCAISETDRRKYAYFNTMRTDVWLDSHESRDSNTFQQDNDDDLYS